MRILEKYWREILEKFEKEYRNFVTFEKKFETKIKEIIKKI